MPKVKRSKSRSREEAEPATAAGAGVRPRDIKYSVAWFRDRVATYALGTIICGAAMLTIAAWMGGTLGAFGKRFSNGVDVIMAAAGLSVQKVNVIGLDPLVEERAREMAGVHIGGNMFGADPFLIKARVEKLDAVSGVKVHRFWPDQVTIIADPREPIALWQDNGGAWRVIDQRGRTFAEADPQQYVHLPRIVGHDASEAAATLVTAMADFPNLASRMETAYRMGGRRWDVKFRGGAEVAFPEDAKLVETLAALNLMHARTKVLDLPVTRIDARHPERFALRPTPGAPKAAIDGDA